MSSGCDIDHRVATLLDDFQKWLEQIRILVRTTILGISSMQMDDRRARFSRRDRRICDFLGRSEEHTSELQSLMRTSYAVFCLKKKNNKSTQHTTLPIPHNV